MAPETLIQVRSDNADDYETIFTIDFLCHREVGEADCGYRV